MIKEIFINGTKIQYDLQYKNVKNINLRIKSDASVYVSANKRVPQQLIEEFVASKSDFIAKAVDKYKNRADTVRQQYYSDDELQRIITDMCRQAYPYYERFGIPYPQIRFRTMVSRWGSCHTVKKILTFNTALVYAPIECVEYVVLHEFTHFLQANHSKRFYEELSKVCPDWKQRRKRLRDISAG